MATRKVYGSIYLLYSQLLFWFANVFITDFLEFLEVVVKDIYIKSGLELDLKFLDLNY